MKSRFTSRILIRSICPVLALGATISYAQTTRTWDGGGTGGTNMDTPVNWSGDVVPTGLTGDTAQWDGTVAGPLSLTYTAAGTGAGLAAAPGIFFNVLPTQTEALTINQASGTTAVRLQGITIASGAGPFTFGSSDLTNDIITLGSGAVNAFTFANNSANTATFGTDARFAFGGGVAKTVTLGGSGNWIFGGKFGSGGTGSITSLIKTGAGTTTINNNIQGTNSGGALVNPGNIFVKAGTLVVDPAGVITTSNFSSVGQSGTDSGTLTLNGSFISGNDFNVGDVGSSIGVLNVQDTGSLTVNTAGGFFAGSANTGGSTASGTVNQTGGTVTVNATADGRFVLGGRNAAAGAGGSGTYNLGGTGTLTNAGNAFIGGYGTGVFVQTAGTFNNTGWVSIARQAGSTGSYTISGGQLNQNGIDLGIIVGEIGNGTMTVTGGAVSTSPTGVIRVGNNALATGTVNLDGGTITASKVNTGGGTSTFNFNGGMLLAAGPSQTFFQGLTTANVRDKGAFIDTNGSDITIAQPLLHSTIATDASVDGGLTKSGFGILTLSGASTYNGPTKLTDDSLIFAGTSTTGNISVADGTFLGAKVTQVNSSVVSATNNPNLNFGTGVNFTVDFSTLGNPTVPVINLGTGTATLAGNVTVSLLNTTALTSTPNNTTLALIRWGAKGGPGNFTLPTTSVGHSTYALNSNATGLFLSTTANPVTWTGALSGAWNDDTLAAPKNWKLPNNSTTDFINGDTVLFTNTATNFALNLTEDVAPGSMTFSNTSNAYTIGSVGGFGITDGTLTLTGSGGVTINNSNTYTGATTINAGTLTINGSLTGSPVTLNAGNLNLSSATAIGPAPLTINGGTLDSPTASTVVTTNPQQIWSGDFNFTGTNDLDLGTGDVTLDGTGDRNVLVSGSLTVGEIHGTPGHGFTKSGPGLLVLTSDGAGAGASVVQGVLNVAGGTLQINRATGPTGDLTAAGVIGSGNVINGSTVNERWLFSNAGTGTFTFSGTLSNGASGALGFNKSGASTQILTGNNSFSGVTTVAGGTLQINGTNTAGGPVNLAGSAATPALLNLQNSNALGTAVVTSTNRNSGIQLQGGITLPSTVSYITSNDGTLGATVPYAIANLSGDNTINGAITLVAGGGGSIIQSDSGSLTLNGNITIGAAQTTRGIILQGASTGANTFSGVLSDLSATVVASIVKNGPGTWTLTGPNTYTGATTVNAGRLVITGNNSAATGAVTVAADATLAGNGNLGGNVTIAANGIHSLAVAATPEAQVTRMITGSLTHTAGDVLNLTTAASPAAGVYTLVTAAGGISSIPTTVTGFTGGVVSISGNSLILTVSGSSPYDSWASSKGLTNGNNGATQDPDFDGVPNLLEFVLNGNPLSSDTGKLPKSSQDATNFYFDFDRRNDSVGEAGLTFEYGTTLTSWPSTVAIPADGTPIAGPPVTITDNGDGTHHLRITVAKSGNTKLFGRLRAVK